MVSVTLLGGFGWYLDRLFGAYHEREYLSQIEAHLRFVSSELASADSTADNEPDEIAEIEALFDQLNASGANEPFHVAILDDDGNLLLEMELLRRFDGLSPSFPEPGRNLDDIPVRHWGGPDGRHLILSSVVVQTPRGPRTVRSALDWTGEAHQREIFRLNAVLALIVGAGLSAMAAAAIARRSLAPVRELALAADRIDVSRLDEPLETKPVPVELRGLVRSLGSMQKRLDESFSRLSAFATDLAHEFRTPLNNLMGEISLALAHPREGEEYRDILGSALEEAQRLSRTIEGLLFVARADRGGVSLRSTPIDLASEIASLVEYYELSAEEKGIQIGITGATRITADKDLIRQAIANLLANAVQYIGAGKKIEVDIQRNGSFAEVAISDDGPGIPPEEIGDVFERFSRGASARKTRNEGSGMGLAIVKSIVHLHGGSATIRSKPGEGTTVVLRIPVEPGSETGMESTS